MFARQRPRGLPCSPSGSLTSVGWLISNRSSRLAFQWLMMSASFLLSSSLLPDIVVDKSIPHEPRCASVPLSKSSRHANPREKNPPPEPNARVSCLFLQPVLGTVRLPADPRTCCLFATARILCASARSRGSSENALRLTLSCLKLGS